MIKRKIIISFVPILAGVILIFQTSLAQKGPGPVISANPTPVFSGLHTLSIHIRDTLTHDSVFHFLSDKLKLPVYYYPHMLGRTMYAGIYAGNLVLEPCGPYSTFKYASDDFRAIFFGLTFSSAGTLGRAADDLSSRGIQLKKGEVYLTVTDTLISGQNLHFSVRQTVPAHKQIFDTLRNAMNGNAGNGPGIESVKMIKIGYKENPGLNKWKDLVRPGKIKNGHFRIESNDLEFQFVKSDIKEVKAIIFRVRSLEDTRSYLLQKNLAGKITKRKIELDASKAFGLDISFEE